MKIKIKLKPLSWFTEKAFEDDDGDYWSRSALEDDKAFERRFVSVRDIQKVYILVGTHEIGYFEWACDEDFIAEHPQYFI